MKKWILGAFMAAVAVNVVVQVAMIDRTANAFADNPPGTIKPKTITEVGTDFYGNTITRTNYATYTDARTQFDISSPVSGLQ